MNIVVEKHTDGWRVHFAHDSKKWERGTTYAEALGKLMLSYYKEFKIESIVLEQKKLTTLAGR